VPQQYGFAYWLARVQARWLADVVERCVARPAFARTTREKRGGRRKHGV
jgi:hypothetical protein